MTTVQDRAKLGLWNELERVLGQVEKRTRSQYMENGLGAQGIAVDQNDLVSSASWTEDREADATSEFNPAASLRETFGLTKFEMDTLLLCAGVALDGRFAATCAAQGLAAGATFGFAVSTLDEPHWSAASRLRPLRYWRLIEFGAGPLLNAPLEIDERILQFLLGIPAADERLEMTMHPLPDEAAEGEQTARTDETARGGALHWVRSRGRRRPLLLTGSRSCERKSLFRALCGQMGMRAWTMDSSDLPESPADRERLARAFTRESALWPVALLVRTPRMENPLALATWLERVDAPVAVEAEAGSPAERLDGVRLETPAMNAAERKALWVSALGPLSVEILAGGENNMDAIVETFALDANEIQHAAEAVREELLLTRAGTKTPQLAWRICRTAARRSLDDLAARIETSATWDDLVLPAGQGEILRQISANARQSTVVLVDWGFASRYSRGLGLSALFAGASGTGKTMAASILARELERDLYQIDLATVVSKYIGETEKHLRRIFDAAERSGAILLFDEADALFGKRSQVRDSHDRYANLEISYLLQRMESYRGIAILTTNMQSALDTAFQRRLRFVVQFPFPDEASRERIWRKVFPAAAPTAGLDFARLAQLNVTGGVIRNIALLAAFLAADENTAIAMRHLLAAARTEFAKLEKPLGAAETRGWE